MRHLMYGYHLSMLNFSHEVFVASHVTFFLLAADDAGQGMCLTVHVDECAGQDNREGFVCEESE